jgi:acyl dehydratase
VSDLRPYRVIARNTATESANKIHDDEVARQLGFRGGLVPGVDVYAYLAHPPAEAWGLGWLQRGTMRARFHQPVYDGGRVEVVPIGPTVLELRDDGGATCATAEVAVAVAEDQREPPSLDDWPRVDQRDHPPPASPEALAPGTVFGLAPHGFHADLAGAYLDDIRETLPLYIDEGVAHPGWILRDANYVLSANVRLGPWIHVESIVQHHGLVRDGDVVSARAVVTNQWERKGHRFVELDVIHLAGTRPVARTRHTAIYRPRGA